MLSKNSPFYMKYLYLANEMEPNIRHKSKLFKRLDAFSWVVFPTVPNVIPFSLLLEPLYLALMKPVGHHQRVKCQNLIQCEHHHFEDLEFCQGLVTKVLFHEHCCGCEIILRGATRFRLQ